MNLKIPHAETRREKLTLKRFLHESLNIGDRERKKKLFTLKFFFTHFRSSPLYFSLLYPQPATLVGSPWKYLRQSRVILHLTYLVRLLYFLTRRRFTVDILTVDDSTKHNEVVVNHNLWESFNIFAFSQGRIERLLYLLELSNARYGGKTLCIGPRNEGEILLFKARGFTDVIGIDLFTYCPAIMPMDVHHMTFPDNSFDTINCGSMLQYLYDLPQAAKEIIRVSKPGARIACSLTNMPPEDEAHQVYFGDARANSIQDILAVFGAHVGHVYFRNDPESLPGQKHELVFQIQKPTAVK